MGFFFNGVFMFKKVIIAVLGHALCGYAIAGSMGPICTPDNVTVPCEARLWDFGAQALYLRSIYGSAKAFEAGTLPLDKEVKNDWNWGYRLEGSYHFNTGNDLNINWLHFSTSINPTDFFGAITIPSLGIPLIPTPFELVSYNRIDQVNAVIGQSTDLSVRDTLRFYGGAQYANIQATAKNYYFLPPILALAGETFSLFDNTDFKGYGPVVGIDYAYYLTRSLSITANGAGSILYGTNRYHAGFIVSPVEFIPEQVFFRRKGIVPSLEGKLGINYTHPTPFGIATLQAGYQIINYFNALEAQTFQNLIGPVIAVDYGVFGPYFGLKLVGDA
jgi:hypothetical protein